MCTKHDDQQRHHHQHFHIITPPPPPPPPPPRPIFSLNYTTKPKEFVPKNSTGVDVPRFEVTFVKVLFLLSNDKLWLSGRYGEGILIHSKSEKVCGVCFSVSKHLRKKCVNLDNNILRHMCVNHPNSKNFVSKGHFCWWYILYLNVLI